MRYMNLVLTPGVRLPTRPGQHAPTIPDMLLRATSNHIVAEDISHPALFSRPGPNQSVLPSPVVPAPAGAFVTTERVVSSQVGLMISLSYYFRIWGNTF